MESSPRSTSAYASCLEQMFALHRFGIKLGLDTIGNMLALLGDPHNAFRSIHIAGTNGKGSIASSLATILQDAGFQVGLYTSPHLVKFNERIQINGRCVSDARVVDLYEAVQKVNTGERQATFFEFATAMALHEFAYRKVDWAVIETGMGGRLDATNIITPELSIITNISLEHKAYLGGTLAQIAAEKAGIIKTGVPVVTGVTQKSVINVIEEIAARRKAPCRRKGKDFRIRRRPDRSFDYYGMHQRIKGVTTRLAGSHQFDNAAISIAACELLQEKGVDLPQEMIRKALAKTSWPGRMEKVCEKPLVILDGAHNLMAVHALANYMQQALGSTPTTLVIGILDDKPYQAMLKLLAPLCKRIILTKPKIDRALAPEILLDIVKPIHPNVEIIEDVAVAFKTAVERSRPNDAVCVAGSLYVVGETKAALAAGILD